MIVFTEVSGCDLCNLLKLSGGKLVSKLRKFFFSVILVFSPFLTTKKEAHFHRLPKITIPFIPRRGFTGRKDHFAAQVFNQCRRGKTGGDFRIPVVH